MEPLLLGQSVEIENAQIMARSLMAETETIKPLIRNWLSLGVYNNKKELQKKAEDFMQADYHYFSNTSFFDNELSSLHQLVNETANLMGAFQLKNFKSILEGQLDIYNRSR